MAQPWRQRSAARRSRGPEAYDRPDQRADALTPDGKVPSGEAGANVDLGGMLEGLAGAASGSGGSLGGLGDILGGLTKDSSG